MKRPHVRPRAGTRAVFASVFAAAALGAAIIPGTAAAYANLPGVPLPLGCKSRVDGQTILQSGSTDTVYHYDANGNYIGKTVYECRNGTWVKISG